MSEAIENDFIFDASSKEAQNQLREHLRHVFDRYKENYKNLSDVQIFKRLAEIAVTDRSDDPNNLFYRVIRDFLELEPSSPHTDSLEKLFRILGNKIRLINIKNGPFPVDLSYVLINEDMHSIILDYNFSLLDDDSVNLSDIAKEVKEVLSFYEKIWRKYHSNIGIDRIKDIDNKLQIQQEIYKEQNKWAKDYAGKHIGWYCSTYFGILPKYLKVTENYLNISYPREEYREEYSDPIPRFEETCVIVLANYESDSHYYKPTQHALKTLY